MINKIFLIYFVGLLVGVSGNGLHMKDGLERDVEYDGSIFLQLSQFILKNKESFFKNLQETFSNLGMMDWNGLLLLENILNFDINQENKFDNEDFEKIAEALGDPKRPPIPPGFQKLTLDCKACLAGIYGMKFAIEKTNYSFIEENSIKACKIFSKVIKVRGDLFCPGTIKLYGPYVNTLVSKNPIFLKKFCPYVNACLRSRNQKVEKEEMEYEDLIEKKEKLRKDVREEEIKNKDENKMEEIEDQNGDVLTVVQLSDIHVEKDYKENTATRCGLPVCCKEKYGKGKAGLYGDYHCNVPEKTVDEFLKKVKSLKPDVVLFSGDASPHTFWEETLETQLSCTTLLTKLIAKHLTTVYPSVGNHETYPTNLFSIKEIKTTKNFLDHFSKSWKDLAKFTPENLKEVSKSGSYSSLLVKGLRLISFNSAYMYSTNFMNVFNHESLIGPSEAKELHKFLEGTLKNAEKAKEKVILMFHHPLGTINSIVSQSVWLEKIILKYKNTIVLTVNGHTHYDEFRVIYDSAKKPASVQLVTPSVSPNGGVNPSMRVFKLDKKTFQLLDYDHYLLNLMELKDISEKEAESLDLSQKIKLIYSPKKQYGMKDLSPQGWNDLINKFEKDDKLFQLYLKHYYTLTKPTSTRSYEKKRHICRMKTVHYTNFMECVYEHLLPLPTFLPPGFTLPSNETIGNFTFPFTIPDNFTFPSKWTFPQNFTLPFNFTFPANFTRPFTLPTISFPWKKDEE